MVARASIRANRGRTVRPGPPKSPACHSLVRPKDLHTNKPPAILFGLARRGGPGRTRPTSPRDPPYLAERPALPRGATRPTSRRYRTASKLVSVAAHAANPGHEIARKLVFVV
jgi:hypothetical protein